MSIKSFIPFVLSGVVCVSTAVADDHAVVSAATADAVDALKDDISAARINPRLTVSTFLKRTGGQQQLIDVLKRAEEVGGPRYSADGQACQIQLEIAGDRVARELISIASSNPTKSPVPPDVLAKELEDWRDRTFSGTGSSVSGSKVRFVQPAAVNSQDPWAGVSDQARQQAVAAAKDSAVRQAIDGIRPIPFTPTQTIGDLLKDKSAADAVTNWLQNLPVRQVHFTATREVELILCTSPDDLCDQVLAAARQTRQALPDAAGERLLRDRMHGLNPQSVGRASAPMAATTSVVIFAVDMPAQPPAWTEQQLIAEATAESRGSKLKTARAAEDANRDSLRKQVDGLRLSDTLTVGQAADRSPSVKRAVEACVDEAKPYKVEYRADGSVMVRSTIDTKLLWVAISEP